MSGIAKELSMETNATKMKGGKTRFAWLGILGIALLLVVIGGWWSSKMMTVMSSAAASDPNVAQAKAGEATKIVMEIAEATNDGKIRGKILKKKTEEIYTRTGEEISIRSSGDTKFVMGKAEDVRAGAVVHLTGTMQEDRSVAAQQIVILTQYVKIE